MVEGYEVDNLQPLVVVDLDGTLIKGNTFRIFMRCGLRHLRNIGAYGRLFRVVALLAMRKARIISHRTLKFKALPLFGSDESLKDEFKSEVELLYNRKVLKLLRDYEAKGYAVLLASAAADTYIPWIWDKAFQATPMTSNPERIENRGEVKLKNANTYAEANRMRIAVVLTDHIDDLPLLEAGAENYLVNPNSKSLQAIKTKRISYTLIND